MRGDIDVASEIQQNNKQEDLNDLDRRTWEVCGKRMYFGCQRAEYIAHDKIEKLYETLEACRKRLATAKPKYAQKREGKESACSGAQSASYSCIRGGLFVRFSGMAPKSANNTAYEKDGIQVEAPCEYASHCGGCRTQNLLYEDQIRVIRKRCSGCLLQWRHKHQGCIGVSTTPLALRSSFKVATPTTRCKVTKILGVAWYKRNLLKGKFVSFREMITSQLQGKLWLYDEVRMFDSYVDPGLIKELIIDKPAAIEGPSNSEKQIPDVKLFFKRATTAVLYHLDQEYHKQMLNSKARKLVVIITK
ncbi:hypothetical protein Tco_0892592 [Tanacetum coccineum]|uniref:Uncharacterized protein n=1 Tax=Tanacetum coccineum TaxID=301880 RepID=A0ABQ5C6P0_9ASTR